MVKRITIIDGHPDPAEGRLCHALAEAYAEGARQQRREVRFLRLADLDIPVLRTEPEWRTEPVPAVLKDCQEAIGSAEHMVFVYPLWLGGMPALLKAFLEQTLRPGFAIGDDFARLLKGRSARIVITMGMPALVYRWYFGAHSLKSLERNILGLCGIGPVRETLIGSVGTMNAGKVERWLGTLRALGRDAR